MRSGGELPAEQFPALSALPHVRHCFTTRVAGLDVASDKLEALKRLDRVHREVRDAFALGDLPLVTTEQVHGNDIAVVDSPAANGRCFTGVDGLVTSRSDVCLGIYVADCCAVFLVDRVRNVIGLVHSGRKGTELGITAKAIELMRDRFGSQPADLRVQLSPCIRPPHYEVDFAADIIRACRACGVADVHDARVCTACDLSRYYSYRAEKGRTGRMLALLAIAPA